MTYKQLKLFAMACMVFDHAVRIFPLHELFLPLAVALETGGHPAAALWLLDTLLGLLAYIGRLAAPIFLYCVASGFFHTRDVKRYLGRILCTALLAQGPYVLFDLAEQRVWGIAGDWRDTGLNILFTLALGLAAVAAYHRLVPKRWVLGLLAVAACGLLARLLHMEGKEGYILLIFVFYRTRAWPRLQRAAAFVPAVLLSRWGLVSWAVTELSQAAVRNCMVNVLGNYLGMLVTLADTGEKGRAGRAFQWGAYLFYPAHFLILACLGFLRPVL